MARRKTSASSKAPPDRGLRRRIGQYLPDIIYGANDGLITTFAVISGVVGGKLSSEVVLILGFANLLADGVSMGASNYLAKRSGGEEDQVMSQATAARHGAITFASFVIIGAIPMIAYIAAAPGWRFLATTVLTLVTLFAVGASRAAVTRRKWWRAGTEMLLIGAAAAGLAYAIGGLMSRLVGTG